MTARPHITRILAQQALELRMRDVLDHLEDLATERAFQPVAHTLEILSVSQAVEKYSDRAPVQALHNGRSTNIVDHLIQREQRLAS